MGGCYFAFNTLASHASCWIAASLYSAHFQGDVRIGSSAIFAFIGGLQTLWLLTAVLFFIKIKRNFWATFYDTSTGRADVHSRFLQSDDDSTKMTVFMNHEDLWVEIKDQVKEFTMRNWARWTAERPDWFNEELKATVPDDFIPREELAALVQQHGGKRRRSTSGFIVPESVPESYARGSGREMSGMGGEGGVARRAAVAPENVTTENASILLS